MNGKVKKLDPTIQAVADLSETVSHLNSSVQNVTNRFSSAKATAGAGAGGVAAAVAKESNVCCDEQIQIKKDGGLTYVKSKRFIFRNFGWRGSCCFKSLPKAKQDQLTEKAQETGVLLRDKAYDAAYAAADLAGDVTGKQRG